MLINRPTAQRDGPFRWPRGAYCHFRCYLLTMLITIVENHEISQVLLASRKEGENLKFQFSCNLCGGLILQWTMVISYKYKKKEQKKEKGMNDLGLGLNWQQGNLLLFSILYLISIGKIELAPNEHSI